MNRWTQAAFLLATFGLFLAASQASAALPSWCDITLSPTSGDRTQDIQNALDAGPGTSSNLHWVCLQNGTYNISGQLRFNKNYTALRGDTSSTLRLTASNAALDGLRITQRTKAKLQYLTFDANSKKRRFAVLIGSSSDVEVTSVNLHNLKNVHGFGINSSSNARINGGTIRHLGGTTYDVQDAIWTNASNNVQIRWVTLLGAGDGPGGDGAFTCYDTVGYTVQGIYSQAAGASGIYLVNCADFELIDNTIHSSSEWALDIVGGSRDGLVRQNTLQGSHFGAMILSNVVCAYPGCQTKNITIESSYMTNNNIQQVATCPAINIGTTTSGITVAGNNYSSQPPVWCWR